MYESYQRNAGFDVYEAPIKDHNYLITVDVARGLGNDYSAFIVFDITNFPIKQSQSIEIMKSNQCYFLYNCNIEKAYNKAFILCEVNDIGDQVASILNYDLYDNLLMCSKRSCRSSCWC